MSSDIAASLKAKDLGNAAFKKGDFPASVGHYTSAILADPNNATFHLNRAAAYLKLGKYQDAERDSSSTLKIQKDNVKALFRRGQARMHLENLQGSQGDLRRALKLEPGNASIKEELQKVEALILEYAKRSKPARTVPSLPKPRTRRVPIQVIDTPPTATTQDDLLTPVSSRPLNRPPPTTPVLGTVENKQPEQKSSQSAFQETKQARSTKSEPPSAPRTKPPTNQPPRAAMNLAAFTRSWKTLTTDKHKWTLLQQIPPASLSHFFASSLEADILSSILGVLLTVLSSGESEQNLIKEYMDRAKEVWRLLDGAGITSEEDDDTKKLWDA